MTAEALRDQIAAQFAPRGAQCVGVAVSGGSDSVALLCLMAELAPRTEVTPVAITVDHRLRDAAADEIRHVTELCGQLGVDHHIEVWTGWDGKGNLQGAARAARYELMADWARGNTLEAVLLGHTADDQAETLLMRMARGAGVDGLSAMPPRRVMRGVTWVRPLLGITRADLRDYLTKRGTGWMEDASNENDAFERVRVRQAMKLLAPLGIETEGLARTARFMREARAALDWQCFLAARELAVVRMGAICLDRRRFRTLPLEIGRRLLIRAISWIARSEYPPRSASVAHALEALKDGKAATLNGVQITPEGHMSWLFREAAAVREQTCAVGDLWDERWRLDGPEDDPDLEVRALGEAGLSETADWRETGLPRAAVLALPAVWRDGTLIAAPGLGEGSDWTAQLEGGGDDFFATLLSH